MEIGKITGFSSAIKNLPDVRSEKIAHIRTKINQGNYKIESDKVAACLVSESLMNATAVLKAYRFRNKE